MARRMTPDEVRALPPLFNRKQADPAFGISESTGKALVRAGNYPVPVVVIGSVQKVRRSDVMAFLGITDAESVPA